MKNTPNQSIKPLTCKRNEKGNLEVGGCDIEQLIDKYGSPLYIYDEATIRTVTKTFQEAFQGTDIHMMFAAKAFMTQAMCKIMQQEGFGLDCVSAGEIYTAKTAGFDMQNIVFNGNNKSYDEIVFAIDSNVGLFSVDNFTEAKMLNNISAAKEITSNILLRITPGIECHTHEYIQTGHLDSKFGFDLSQIDDIVTLIKKEYKNLNLIGLHAHVGSQIFQKDVYADAVEIMLKEANRINEAFGIKLTTFNVGGGAGIKYVENDDPVSIFEIADTIKNALKINSEKYGIENPHLYIEPGRCIVGTAGITVYTVGSFKQVPNGRKYVAVDGGMADNIRPALYEAKYSVEAIQNKKDEQLEEITIAGRFCESGDILAKNVKLPKLYEGDLICFYDTGAYCYSMASNYNRVLKPAAIIVKDGKSDIIINRQTLDNIIENDCIPEILG